MSNFFNTKNHKNRLIFDNYSNDKKWTFLEHNVCRACVDFTNTDSMVHTTEECFLYTYKDGSVTLAYLLFTQNSFICVAE